MRKTITQQFHNIAHLLSNVAGESIAVLNPLLADFILLAQKLEKLGFVSDPRALQTK